jgi:hypothetical protein
VDLRAPRVVQQQKRAITVRRKHVARKNHVTVASTNTRNRPPKGAVRVKIEKTEIGAIRVSADDKSVIDRAPKAKERVPTAVRGADRLEVVVQEARFVRQIARLQIE